MDLVSVSSFVTFVPFVANDRPRPPVKNDSYYALLPSLKFAAR